MESASHARAHPCVYIYLPKLPLMTRLNAGRRRLEFAGWHPFFIGRHTFSRACSPLACVVGALLVMEVGGGPHEGTVSVLYDGRMVRPSGQAEETRRSEGFSASARSAPDPSSLSPRRRAGGEEEEEEVPTWGRTKIISSFNATHTRTHTHHITLI